MPERRRKNYHRLFSSKSRGGEAWWGENQLLLRDGVGGRMGLATVLEPSGNDASQSSGGWCREVVPEQEIPAQGPGWHLWVPLEASSWAWQLVVSSSPNPMTPDPTLLRMWG